MQFRTEPGTLTDHDTFLPSERALEFLPAGRCAGSLCAPVYRRVLNWFAHVVGIASALSSICEYCGMTGLCFVLDVTTRRAFGGKDVRARCSRPVHYNHLLFTPSQDRKRHETRGPKVSGTTKGGGQVLGPIRRRLEAHSLQARRAARRVTGMTRMMRRRQGAARNLGRAGARLRGLTYP